MGEFSMDVPKYLPMIFMVIGTNSRCKVSDQRKSQPRVFYGHDEAEAIEDGGTDSILMLGLLKSVLKKIVNITHITPRYGQTYGTNVP